MVEERPAASSPAGATPARSTSCRPSRPPSPARDSDGADYEHRVVLWDEVGEEEGTGIVHIAPGCGAEDFALGKSLGLPMIAPLDENGVVIPGFGPYSGRDVRDVMEPDRRVPQARAPLLPARDHHAPLPALLALRHAARLPPRGRVVHLHGPGLRQAARELTTAEVDASLRYQIMDVIDGHQVDPRLRL